MLEVFHVPGAGPKPDEFRYSANVPWLLGCPRPPPPPPL